MDKLPMLMANVTLSISELWKVVGIALIYGMRPIDLRAVAQQFTSTSE